MDGYKLFRRHRQGKSGVALYFGDCLDCIELNDCNDKVECLWVKMKGKANKADILLGVCKTTQLLLGVCKTTQPLNQDEEVDEIFYKRLAEVSLPLALVLRGHFLTC